MSSAKPSIHRSFLFALALAFAASIGSARAETLSGQALVEQLQRGGYVLLMRHASSPPAPPSIQDADPENKTLERQLDAKGRSSAVAMGQAIKKLAIPVGRILSSPTYRALETIRLAALGSAKTYAELGDGGQSMQASAVSSQASWLRELVSEKPPSGSDTIIVTHMPNIVAGFDGMASDLSDGEALVFQPEGNGNANLVAKIKIEDWPALAR